MAASPRNQASPPTAPGAAEQPVQSSGPGALREFGFAPFAPAPVDSSSPEEPPAPLVEPPPTLTPPPQSASKLPQA